MGGEERAMRGDAMGELVVLGVRPDAHAFGYAFVKSRGGQLRVLDVGVIRARGAYGGTTDPGASVVRQGRELAGLLRVVASRERVSVIAAPAFVVPSARARPESIADVSRAWGHVDLLAEAMGVRVVVVPPADVAALVPALQEQHAKAEWVSELGSGERLSGVAVGGWVALGAAQLACTSGRVAALAAEQRSA